MSNITKSPSVSNYKNVSVSKVKPNISKQFITHIYGKGESHNNPDHRSGNERIILDHFYSNAHNLKASFLRLTSNDPEQKTTKQYYRAHEEEVIAGALDLIDAINRLLSSCKSCDQMYGTHFKFLSESILNDNEASLEKIGITHHNYNYKVNRKVFLDTLCEEPNTFSFLFSQPHGLIEMLSKVYYKIQGITDTRQSEGRIIDYRT